MQETNYTPGEGVHSPRIVERGRFYDTFSLPGLVAEIQGVPVGLLLYHIHRGECEVVVVIATRRRQGIGRILLEALKPIARSSGCRRLWLITTNDNTGAMAFCRVAAAGDPSGGGADSPPTQAKDT